MKKIIFLISLLLVPLSLFSQFEHKMSFNLEAGGFKTFGYATGTNDYDPLQMPHYRPGMIVDGGLQFNINRRISILINSGIYYSWRWEYIDEDGSSWLEYTLHDADENFIDDGENELKFFNFTIGLTPKLYISPGKKWNPYLFAGINFNYTRAYYADNYWYDSNMYGVLPPDETEPYSPFLENNVGMGFSSGIGIEYSPGDKISYTLVTGYSLIKMKEENFKSEDNVENFNAFFIKSGIRFNFLKSKNL